MVVVVLGAVVFVVVAGVGASHLADPVFHCPQPVVVVVAVVDVVGFTPSMIAHMLVCVDVHGVSMTSMAVVIGVLVVMGRGGVVGEVDVVLTRAVVVAGFCVVVTLTR